MKWRMGQDAAVNRPLVIAHRGLSEGMMENTADSFRAALADGADILEVDVRLSADHEVVIAHDEDFSRLGGPRTPISQMTRRALESVCLRSPQGVMARPLFMDRALQNFPEAHFNVDLKDTGAALVQAWFKLLTAAGAEQRCRTASFHDSSLRMLRRLNPAAPLSVGRFGVIRLLAATALSLPLRPRGAQDTLQIPEQSGPLRVLTARRAALWREWGWKLHVWTIDAENDMEKLIRWGVDGIITNRPLILSKVAERVKKVAIDA